MSRLEKSSKNIVFSLLNTILSSVLGLVARTFFIQILGAQYLGLSGLLMNVLGFLSISDLGISTAIGFSLYKPLAERDFKTVSSLMSLYRKAYRIIGIIVAASGIGLFFFLDFFVPKEQQPEGTTYAYFAFLSSIAVSYFFSYKSTLISSDNQAYRIVPIGAVGSIIQTALQIIFLFLTKSYVVYLSIQLLGSFVILVIQNRYITKLYKDVDFYSTDKISDSDKKTIKRNIGGLIIAKIGDYLVNSTDNLIITKLISLATTGVYSNYLLIRNLVNGYIATLFAALTAAMGNVVATESDERKEEIFNTMFFCSFFIYSFEAVCFMCLFNTFIGDVWIGNQYTFDAFTVAIIVLNNYLTGLRIPIITMKNAAGKYMEDSWVPFAFSAINLIASIVLANIMGVAGVFLGTIIGSVLTADWYRPLIIYKTVFHTSVKKYFKKYLFYIFLGCTYTALAFWLCSFVNFPFGIINLFVKGIIASAIPIIFNVLFFRKTKEFEAVRQMKNRIFTGIKNKIKKRTANE